MENCLPSLLASGNIPALPNLNNQNRFLFCTTPEDCEWLQTHPNFILLSRYIIPKLVPIDLITEESHQKLGLLFLSHKLYMVTQAHILLLSRMHQAKCIASLVFPDTIYAKNALKSVYPHILNKNKKAILAHFPRFSTPELLEALNEAGYIKPHKPIEIENRILISYALKHKNFEILVQNWKSLYAFDFVTEIWWPLAKNRGMLCHSFTWCPVFIDYSKVTSHNLACLENNTIDGSYLYNNFTKDDLYVVTDSDEFVMISYAPHAKLYCRNKIGDERRFSEILKISHWRKMIKLLPGFIDPLKLELLKHPVFVHESDLTRRDYDIEKKSRRTIQKIFSEPNKCELFSERVLNSKRPLATWFTKKNKKNKKLSEEELLVKKLLETHSLPINP